MANPCLEMELLLSGNDREILLFSTILKFSVLRGWITEHERQRVDSKTTLSEKKSEFFDVLKTMECDEDAIRLLRAIRSMNEFESLCKGNEEDKHYFTTIMSKLFEESLLAQGKKLRPKNIEKKKDPVIYVSESAKMAMSLGPVIRCVLQYLNLNDIKTCRSVSKEWKSIAEPILRNRSKIKFHHNETSTEADATLFHPYKFLEQFASTLETMPFTAFTISCFFGRVEKTWTFNELNDFFLHESENIRELEINNLVLVDEDEQNVKSFDVTQWIERSPVTKGNSKYNTKLSLTGDSFGSCKLIVQNAILAHVKELSLDECRVSLKSNQDEQTKPQPIKLTLTDVSFFRDGKRLPELEISEVMDFSRAKYIDLKNYGDNTKLSISLKGYDKLHLDYLRLIGVVVTDWRECTWTVDKLEMSGGYNFVKKTKLKIRELDLRHLKVLDLCVLPQSLNKLTIDFDEVERCLSSQKAILDNLLYLKLSTLNKNIFSTVSEYVEFPHLIYLDLGVARLGSDFDGDQLEINSDWIPRSVRKIKLCYVTVNWGEESKDFNVEKLVLTDKSFCSVKKIGNILSKTKELVLRCDCDNIDSKTVGNILEYLRLKNSNDYCQRVYVGPFNWTEDYSFKESALVDHVDMEGKYYLFENQVGKALDISDEEFDEFGNIEPITSAMGKC